MNPRDMKPGDVYDFSDLPPGVMNPYLELAESLFKNVANRGNTKDEIHALIESMLKGMEASIIDTLKTLDAEAALKFSGGMMVATAAIRVAFRNPLYESDALTSQLIAEVHNILRHAGGVVMENPSHG